MMKQAEVFKALGDGTRLEIVQMLAKTEEMCACRILERFSISQPTLSHHMKVLMQCGLVEGRKEGKWMHYSLHRGTAGAVRRTLQLLEQGGNAARSDITCCPKTSCPNHGNCAACVRKHALTDSLPYCLFPDNGGDKSLRHVYAVLKERFEGDAE